MTEEKTLREAVSELTNVLKENENKKKEKKFRLPGKAKLSNRRLKQGYVTVCSIFDNKTVDFKKYQIEDNTIKIGNKYHAVNDDDIFIFKGKPLIIQAEKKLNPYNPLSGKNETYGQPYVMSRMLKDTIKVSKSFGAAGLIIILIIAGVIVYALFTGGGA